MENKCRICDEIQRGDSLYIYTSSDIGITFEEIPNVQYCPVCGKQLLTYKEEYIDIKDFLKN